MGRYFNVKIIPSDKEQQVIEGCLLGDGHLKKYSWASSYFSYGSSQIEHVQYVLKLLNRFSTKKFKNGQVRQCKNYNKLTEKTYLSYAFWTQCNPTFFEFRQKWYDESQKVVPRELNLTSIVCLLWYIGDGSLTPGQTILLATNGFRESDVDFLINQLNNFNFEAYKVRNYRQHVIKIPRRNIKKFLDFIGPCPVACYNYKWEYIDYDMLYAQPKQVLQMDFNNNLIRQWDSGRQIQRELGYAQSNISNCCVGKYKTAYGFKWKFVDDIWKK